MLYTLKKDATPHLFLLSKLNLSIKKGYVFEHILYFLTYFVSSGTL